MKVKFNDMVYKSSGGHKTSLGHLCFGIFKQYITLNNNLDYKDIRHIFNERHCDNNFIVLSEDDWKKKPEGVKKRYFDSISYNGIELYFSTQWGNNGGECDNIDNMINFAIGQKYSIDILEYDDLNKDENKNEDSYIKNIILYGSPGVGKTYNTKKLISLIESGKSNKEIFETIKNNGLNDLVNIDDISDRVKFITFHQSFGYEDFIEGFRPNDEGKIELEDGVFKNICDEAQINFIRSIKYKSTLEQDEKEELNNYYLVIDEINRGNISKIFGELITLIEEDKRDTLTVTLPYSKKPFKIPSNLYIIGTMNSTDKSIALIDIALRRRFTFLKMEPNLDLVKNVRARSIMGQLNDKITEVLGVDYVLGHSYFMKIDSDDDLDFVLEYKITPLLEEYFYGDVQGLKSVMKIVNNSGDDDNV